jgi:sulfide:quinone oxidoreductase
MIDTTKELRSAWWLKLYVLKPMYFHLMLRGLA